MLIFQRYFRAGNFPFFELFAVVGNDVFLDTGRFMARLFERGG